MRKDLSKDESGQAIVEYVIILAMVVSVVTMMSSQLRRALFTFWETMAKEISAACPDCPKDPTIRF